MPINLSTLLSVEARPILWDVVEQHLDEAEFLFERWESALHSPKYRLDELAKTVERRLLAHLDGLVIGGPAVAEKLLYPARLDAEEAPRVVVAALALMAQGADGVQAVWDAFHSGNDALRSLLGRALSLSDVEELDARVLLELEACTDEPGKAQILDITVQRGIDPGAALHPCFESEHPQLIAAGLRAVCRFARRSMLYLADRHSESAHRLVRYHAVKAGRMFGSERIWERGLDAARSPGPIDRDLLLLISLVGSSDDHEIVYRKLGSARADDYVLWLLGFIGTVHAGDTCSEFLNGKNIRSAKQAAESMAWISGLDYRSDVFHSPTPEPVEEDTLPAFEDDDLDASLLSDGVDELPFPKRDAVHRGWNDSRPHFNQHRRIILGRPFSPEALWNALDSGALWRRHAVTLEAAMRTHGFCHVSTDTFSARQRRDAATRQWPKPGDRDAPH